MIIMPTVVGYEVKNPTTHKVMKSFGADELEEVRAYVEGLNKEQSRIIHEDRLGPFPYIHFVFAEIEE